MPTPIRFRVCLAIGNLSSRLIACRQGGGLPYNLGSSLPRFYRVNGLGVPSGVHPDGAPGLCPRHLTPPLSPRFDFEHQTVRKSLAGLKLRPGDVPTRDGLPARCTHGFHVFYVQRNGIPTGVQDEVRQTVQDRTFLVVQRDTCGISKLQQIMIVGACNANVSTVSSNCVLLVWFLPYAMSLECTCPSAGTPRRIRGAAPERTRVCCHHAVRLRMHFGFYCVRSIK